MRKITIISIIVVILIILIPQIKFEYRENIKTIKIGEDPQFKNGDVIMFKYDTPLVYYKNGKRNSSLYIGKAIQNSLSYWFHGNHYTHCGIIVDNHIVHLNSDPFYDNYTQQWSVGDKPVWSRLEDLYAYPGFIYIHRSEKVGISISSIPNVKMRNDVIDGIREHVFHNIVDEHYYSCARVVSEIQESMGIKTKNKFADLASIIDTGYESAILIETPWSKSRGF